MRVFIDVSGSSHGAYAYETNGRKFLDFLSKFAEGYVVQFDHKIRCKDHLSADVVIEGGGESDPNCLGPIHLANSNEIKILLSDGLHPKILHQRNLIQIDPQSDFDPKSLALNLSMVDDQLRRLDLLATLGS